MKVKEIIKFMESLRKNSAISPEDEVEFVRIVPKENSKIIAVKNHQNKVAIYNEGD